MLLALDSVFEQCSVAVLAASGEVIGEQTLAGSRHQTQHILPMIDQLLHACNLTLADVQAIAFNRGPGAFSGIRINTAVAQALAFAHDLPCLPVSSLQAIAQASMGQDKLADASRLYAVLDARMNQVYIGEFVAQAGLMQPANLSTEAGGEWLMDYHTQPPTTAPLVGSGAELLTPHAGQVVISDICPTAVDIGKLGLWQWHHSGGVPAEQALPVYLRHNAWKTLAEQQKTS